MEMADTRERKKIRRRLSSAVLTSENFVALFNFFHMRIAQNRDRECSFCAPYHTHTHTPEAQMQRHRELCKPIKSDLLFFCKIFQKAICSFHLG